MFKFHTNQHAAMLTLLAFLLFALGDAIIKFISHWPPFSMAAAFGLGNLSCMMLYFISQGKPLPSLAHKPNILILYGLMGLVTSLCNIYALPKLALPTFYVIVFSFPFLMTIGAKFLFKEEVTMRSVLAIGVGFIGVLIALKPSSAGISLAALAALCGTLCFVMRNLLLRGAGKNHHPLAFSLTSNLMLAVVGIIGAIGFQEVLAFQSSDFLFLALLCSFASIGLVAIIHAMQITTQAALIAPLHYSQLLWGTLLSWFVFHDLPDKPTLFGAVLVIGSGLILMWPKAQSKKI